MATAVKTTPAASYEAQQSAPTGLRRLITVLGYGVLILVAFIQVAPFVLTIANSFKCDPAITSRPGAVLPSFNVVSCQTTDASGNARVLGADQQTRGAVFDPSLDGYNQILAGSGQSNNLPRWLLNNFIYSITVLIGRIIFDSMAGYALARLKFPGNRFVFFIVLGVLMIPGVVLLIPRFLMLNSLGLLNSYQGYFLVLAADAFGILLMKQFFESIPKEIEEAALVDGAGRFVTFFRVILPMATPALVALAIFSFQGQWNNFMDALIIVGTDPAMFNLPMGLTVLQGSGQDVQYDLVLAGAVITTIPMAIIFFMFQRYFVEGVNYSGLAGQ